uniref:FAD-dependent monooxygenase n=1 Tax=Pseudonocardia pini TaxID=2758030 RepID=UPI0015F028F8
RGIDALAEIGALDAVVAVGAGYPKPPLRQFDASGTLVAAPDLPGRPDGRPAYLIVYRPDLARVLRETAAAAGATLQVGVTVAEITRHPDRVDVTFTDGRTGSYDLLVGADGLRSSVRAQVFDPDIQPASAGSLSLRWLPADAGLPEEAGLYYGEDAELVLAPMGDRTYLSVQHADDSLLDDAEARRLLRTKLDQFDSPTLRRLRERLTDDQVVLARRYEWLLVEGPWHRGRVVLIGDAAHATTAHLAAGGVMALEDAVSLAQELGRGGSVDECLERFHSRRIGRCRMVVETSVQLSDMQKNGATGAELNAVRWPALQILAQPF